ncbi:16S rRNA (uracil(1498)-N(3))-methyltransferase [Nitrincola tapanii]|uniref:Ribosomal RNA small subunit methyltransferase E n=1 Tax=Nitrincola tapanii TaxID=1708751 RepID=A0A5A9VYV2_9GAMM|nr:16S rRNA (uracil(1498)-N(3))-methyltransferase [Nitrincola tapanii]KAA0873552.1 16S rRNA (uracil(1498)-N(3))-methyltransferase [Nitrincola tapanii]
MNLILLYPEEVQASGQILSLKDRRFQHIAQIHQPQIGDRLRAGLINGPIGEVEVLALSASEVQLRWHLAAAKPSPDALPLELVMALPRPKMLKRVLQTAATLGVKSLWLIHSYRVDKSYWSTPVLSPDSVHEHLCLGLEQAGDTLLPQVHLRKRFKPFVEDELPALVAGRRALVAHPYQAQDCPAPAWQPSVLVLGPEGGFIPYEIAKLQEAGVESVSLGSRILRVETALPVLLTRLFPLR